MPLLIDRTVPRPGLRLSILGFGGTTLGGRHVYADVDEAQAAATVGEAWARGVRYFDTAPFYGTGASEVRLGRALRRFARGEYVLSTKVGRRLEPLPPGEVNREGAPFRRVFDYSYDGTLRALEDSLERLQRDRIDIVYIHDVGNADHFHDAMDGAYRALERLRREGAIDAIGAGVSQWEICRDFAHAGDFDLLMLACRYTLVEHQLALHELLPLCLEKRDRRRRGGAVQFRHPRGEPAGAGCPLQLRPGRSVGAQPGQPSRRRLRPARRAARRRRLTVPAGASGRGHGGRRVAQSGRGRGQCRGRVGADPGGLLGGAEGRRPDRPRRAGAGRRLRRRTVEGGDALRA
jgi:Aldo/keto reductase family